MNAPKQIPDRELLERACEFDRVAKDILDRRTRQRKDISKMHDTAKRTQDETAKRLGL